MALIKCPECKREVSDKAEVCIHCGYPIAKLRGCNDIILDSTDSSKYKIRVTDVHEYGNRAVALVGIITRLNTMEASKLIEKNYSPIILAGLNMKDAEVIKEIFETRGISVVIEPDNESTQSTTLNLNAEGKLGVRAINYFVPKQDENDFLFCPRCR